MQGKDFINIKISERWTDGRTRTNPYNEGIKKQERAITHKNYKGKKY